MDKNFFPDSLDEYAIQPEEVMAEYWICKERYYNYKKREWFCREYRVKKEGKWTEFKEYKRKYGSCETGRQQIYLKMKKSEAVCKAEEAQSNQAAHYAAYVSIPLSIFLVGYVWINYNGFWFLLGLIAVVLFWLFLYFFVAIIMGPSPVNNDLLPIDDKPRDYNRRYLVFTVQSFDSLEEDINIYLEQKDSQEGRQELQRRFGLPFLHYLKLRAQKRIAEQKRKEQQEAQRVEKKNQEIEKVKKESNITDDMLFW